LSGWPANSPDLSPIELLWAILKHTVAQLEPKTFDELTQVLGEAWDNISMTVITRLCTSLPQRLALCQGVGGQSIGKLLHLCGEEGAAERLAAENRVP
jgi:hypothetical protein